MFWTIVLFLLDIFKEQHKDNDREGRTETELKAKAENLGRKDQRDQARRDGRWMKERWRRLDNA